MDGRHGTASQTLALLRAGWVVLALTVVSFVGAMILGDWLLSLQGYDVNESGLPTSVMLTAGLPALLVLVAPAVVATFIGAAVARRGDQRGRTLEVVAGVIALAALAANLIQGLATALGF